MYMWGGRTDILAEGGLSLGLQLDLVLFTARGLVLKWEERWMGAVNIRSSQHMCATKGGSCTTA
jgi:hypothetical protein